MRTLEEIVETARDGHRPDPDECYFAMLALDKLVSMAKDRPRIWQDMGAGIVAEAKNADPIEFLGTQRPGNQVYDYQRRVRKHLIHAIERDQELDEAINEACDDPDLCEIMCEISRMMKGHLYDDERPNEE